jgi:hypothetical protein
MKMKPRPVYGVKFLHRARIAAIVLYPWILFASERVSVSPSIIRHELEHVRQLRRLGFLGFYLGYIAHYLKARLRGASHWNAYYFHPYEVAARAAESDPMTAAEKEIWAGNP